MTAFLQCFWISTQIGFALFRNLVSSFGKVYDPFCTEISWANLEYFSKDSTSGIQFSDFSDSRAKKIGLWAWGRFCVVFMCNILPIFLQYWQLSINSLRCSTKVFRMNLPVDMALALFRNNFQIIEMIVKGVSTNPDYFVDWIAYWIAYWFRGNH